MSDTQWTTADPAGQNPTTVAVSIIDQLNPQFIAAGVKFVIQVGDLADTGNDADETVRAQAAQPLYDAGIGFFPMRGNHETYGTGNSFAIPVLQSLYPQTRGLSNTFGATNFSSPTRCQHRARWHELLVRLQQRPLRDPRSLGDAERGHLRGGIRLTATRSRSSSRGSAAGSTRARAAPTMPS
jgi:hypothetical protein